MATAFITLYPLVRALLGDHDAQVRMYSDTVLDAQLRLRLLTDNDPVVLEDGTTRIFTTELTPVQKALLIYRMAKAILAPQADFFSYKTPVHSVTRRGHILSLRAYLDEQLELLEGGSALLRYDSDLDAMIHGSTRYLSDLNAALISD